MRSNEVEPGIFHVSELGQSWHETRDGTVMDRCERCGEFYPQDDMADGLCPECQADQFIEEHTCTVCGEFYPNEDVLDGVCDKCYWAEQVAKVQKEAV